MELERLINLLTMTDNELHYYLEKELKSLGKEPFSNLSGKKSFTFAKGSFPVLLVAHTDTVYNSPPKEKDIKLPCSEELSCSYGIGGDDRCGIELILNILKEYDCSVLFCSGEEEGGIGAYEFIDHSDKLDLPKFNYIIELDRRGFNEAVYYGCANEEFEQFIKDASDHYFKTDLGSFTDISIIAPALGIAAVNLSTGYIYEHQGKKERIHLDWMEIILYNVKKILKNTDKNKMFEYIDGEMYNLFPYSMYELFTDDYN